jgi:hypothetical protein
VEEEEAGGGWSEEAGYVGRGELVYSFQVPVSSISLYRERVVVGGKAYIWLLVHCISSTKSKLLCTMNGFICLASWLNRATPSPPCFEVPNSSSKSGWSYVPTMQK